MNKKVRKLYLARRAEGYNAQAALRDAKILHRFDLAEIAGLVRMEWHPDMHAQIEDLEGDCFNERGNPGVSALRLERMRKDFIERVDREGVWGRCGQFRLDPFEEDEEEGWIDADSCWGFVGQDAHMYEADIMNATLSALTEAMRKRCPCCRQQVHSKA